MAFLGPAEIAVWAEEVDGVSVIGGVDHTLSPVTPVSLAALVARDAFLVVLQLPTRVVRTIYFLKFPSVDNNEESQLNVFKSLIAALVLLLSCFLKKFCKLLGSVFLSMDML